jgi:hypothetical protein
MLDSLGLLRVAFAAALAFAVACGGDDEIDPDFDSSVSDAEPIDGEDLCPGAFTFEALAGDLESDAAVNAVEVVEVGDEGNATTSAPNGRVVLCLPSGVDSAIRAEKADFLTREDAISIEAATAAAEAGQPYPLHVIGGAEIEALFTDLALTYDPDDAQVVVSVLSYPDGTALEGATVAIDKASDAALARDGSGGFAAGDEIAAGGLMLFANVPIAGGDVEITVTPPAGTCSGPATIPLLAGGMSGALFACQ